MNKNMLRFALFVYILQTRRILIGPLGNWHKYKKIGIISQMHMCRRPRQFHIANKIEFHIANKIELKFFICDL